MQSWQKAIGLIGAILPIGYCGWLVWYFVDMGGWDDPTLSKELQPTILGLGLIGLFFVLWLGFRIRRTFFSGKPPQSGGGPGSAFALDDNGPDGTPDADAIVARYLAMRNAEGDAQGALAPRSQPARGPVTFGRRTT